MEKGALAEKKFLESKDKLFKMVESGQMSQAHFINIIDQLNEQDPYMGQNYSKFYPNPKPGKVTRAAPTAPPSKPPMPDTTPPDVDMPEPPMAPPSKPPMPDTTPPMARQLLKKAKPKPMPRYQAPQPRGIEV